MTNRNPNPIWYLAGPMTGYLKDNLPAFVAAAAALRATGFEVLTPVEFANTASIDAVLAGSPRTFNEIDGTTWGQALGRDVTFIADKVTGIVFLDGWEKSRGARLEAFTAVLNGHEFGRYLQGGLIEGMSSQTVLAKLMRYTSEEIRNGS